MRIHITVSAATLQYYEYCVQNHKALADWPDDLEFVGYCLDQQTFDSLKARGAGAVLLPPGNSGSVAHMLGISAAIDNAKKDDINIISDGDCIVLMKGWDTELERLMLTCDCVGTIYEDVGGFSSGAEKAQTYKRVPNFTWIALSPRFDWKFDVSCDKQNLLKIETPDQSAAFNLPIGFSLFREPCWKFPLYIHENGIKYRSLEFVRPTSGLAKAVLSGEDYHTEYSLNSVPFVAHQRGSMSKKFRTHPLSTTFYDTCEAYMVLEFIRKHPDVKIGDVEIGCVSQQNVHNAILTLQSRGDVEINPIDLKVRAR